MAVGKQAFSAVREFLSPMSMQLSEDLSGCNPIGSSVQWQGTQEIRYAEVLFPSSHYPLRWVLVENSVGLSGYWLYKAMCRFVHLVRRF